MIPVKMIVSFSVCLSACLSVKAQHFKTNESIAAQLTNNRQPGALYAPVTKPSVAVNNNNNATNAAAPANQTNTKTTTSIKKAVLASDQSVQQKPIPVLHESPKKQ